MSNTGGIMILLVVMLVVMGFGVSTGYKLGVTDTEKKVEIRVAHPDDVQSKIVRVNNQIDYRIRSGWSPEKALEKIKKEKS